MMPAILPDGPVFTKEQAVYVLHVPRLGYFKIGRAKDPIHRAGQIQGGCPEKIELIGASQIAASGISASDFETALHDALFPYRSHGEWFAKLNLEQIYSEWKRVWNNLVESNQESGGRTDEAVARDVSAASGSRKADTTKAHNKAGMGSERSSPPESTTARTDVLRTVGATASARSGTIKRGRPRIGEVRDKPWEAQGISKATYYRRKAEERSK